MGGVAGARRTSRARRAPAPADDARVEGRLVLQIADEDVEAVAEMVARLLLDAWAREGSPVVDAPASGAARRC